MNQIISDYNSRLSLHDIARKNHTHYTKIKEYLRNNGIVLRKVPNKTSVHKNTIIRLYKSGIDSAEIGRRLDIASTNVLKCLMQNNIERRKREQYCKKYPINLDLFRDPSTEICAYWLGFLYADGNLRKTKTSSHVMKLKIQLRDIKHIYKFTKDLCTTKMPTKQKPKLSKDKKRLLRSATIIITNKEFYHILKSYGWFEFKRGELVLPKNLHLRHFLRGLFDGDGIVTTSDRKRYLRIGFCSPHQSVVEYVKRLCDNWIHADYYKRKIDKQHIYYIYWVGSTAIDLARYLYCNSQRYLDRKIKRVYEYI